jgi:hypothetical protein
MIHETRRFPINKKYIVRLTDQERDELVIVIKRGQNGATHSRAASTGRPFVDSNHAQSAGGSVPPVIRGDCGQDDRGPRSTRGHRSSGPTGPGKRRARMKGRVGCARVVPRCASVYRQDRDGCVAAVGRGDRAGRRSPRVNSVADPSDTRRRPAVRDTGHTTAASFVGVASSCRGIVYDNIVP